MSDRGTLKVTVGGVSRTLRVEIAAAPEIEEATGKGVVSLTRDVISGAAKLTDAVEVIRVVLRLNGIVYTSTDLLEAIKAEGILTSMRTAGLMLNELFRAPEGAARSGKAPAAAKATEMISH